VGTLRSDPFTEAVHARDLEAMRAALSPRVRFLSPVVFRPYEGRELVLGILGAAMRVLEDFTYVQRIEDGDVAALIFRARVGDRDIDGLDLLGFDADGLVRELKVMVRPMSGVHVLAEAMGAQLEAAGIAPPVG
jgi:hypothetical protein